MKNLKQKIAPALNQNNKQLQQSNKALQQVFNQINSLANQLPASAQVVNKAKKPPPPTSAAIHNAVAQPASNLPAPPKPFHTRPGKSRSIKTIEASQSVPTGTSVATAKYKAFLNRALSSSNKKDEVSTDVLRERLGLPPEEKEEVKNLYLMDNLTDAEKYMLLRNMKEKLSVYFDGLNPTRKYSNDSTYIKTGVPDNVCYHTATAYQYIPEPNFDIEVGQITERKVIDACLLITEYPRLTNTSAENDSNAAEVISKIDKDRYDVTGVLKKVGSKILKELYNNSGDIEKVEVMEALEHYKEQGKIISVLEESQKAYADIFKLSDKYSIRIGDGERFVASDNVKITFRDPSENPAWAIWFMDAVPLNNVPDRTSMLFMPKDQWAKQYPEPLENHPIVCHASLWQLPENQTGVLLHTAWHNLAVAYRWQIDKPLDVARIMFKAVSHPAHIARNFGYAPQIREPGEGWF